MKRHNLKVIRGFWIFKEPKVVECLKTTTPLFRRMFKNYPTIARVSFIPITDNLGDTLYGEVCVYIDIPFSFNPGDIEAKLRSNLITMHDIKDKFNYRGLFHKGRDFIGSRIQFKSIIICLRYSYINDLDPIEVAMDFCSHLFRILDLEIWESPSIGRYLVSKITSSKKSLSYCDYGWSNEEGFDHYWGYLYKNGLC